MFSMFFMRFVYEFALNIAVFCLFVKKNILFVKIKLIIYFNR